VNGESVTDRERRLLELAVARLRTGVLAVVFGLLGATGLALATAWLLLLDRQPLGPHLSLLAIYFPGYSVSWPGVAIGFLYGLASGAAIGATMGWSYNRVADWRARRASSGARSATSRSTSSR